jgi:hypothetical protein
MQHSRIEVAWRDRRLAVVGLAVAAVYAAWFPVSGTGDVDIWLGWMRDLGDSTPAAAYFSSHRDYPPGGFLLLELPRMLSQASGMAPLLALKTLLVLAALAAAGVLLAWSRKPLSAAFFLLAVAVNVVAHGYLDILVAMPLLLALRALDRRRVVAAGALYAAAVAIKWQPLIIAPFVLVEACRGARASAGWIGALDGAGRLTAGALVVAVPLLVVFDAAAILEALRLAFQHNSLSLQGLNLNWLVQLGLYVGSHSTGALSDVDVPQVVGVLARAAFWAAYATVLWLFIRGRQSFADFVWYSGVAFYSYCMLSVGVHENHLFLTVVLAFALLCTGHPDATWIAVCMSVASTVNLLLFYDLRGHGLWDPSAPMAHRWFIGASVAASLLNMMLWAVLVYRAMRMQPRSGASESSVAVA